MKVSMQQEACVLPGISISSLRSIISTRTKLQISNKITILQAYNTGFIPDAGYRHNTLFVIRKETDKKIPT